MAKTTTTDRFTFLADGAVRGLVTGEDYRFKKGETVEAPTGEFVGAYVRAERVTEDPAPPASGSKKKDS